MWLPAAAGAQLLGLQTQHPQKVLRLQLVLQPVLCLCCCGTAAAAAASGQAAWVSRLVLRQQGHRHPALRLLLHVLFLECCSQQLEGRLVVDGKA